MNIHITPNMLIIQNVKAAGTPAFNVRVVLPGEAYGPDMGHRNDEQQPLLEFYYSAFPGLQDDRGGNLGRFLNRFKVSTLFPEGRTEDGAIIPSSIGDFTIEAEEMCIVANALRERGVHVSHSIDRNIDQGLTL